jgi:hypothetical protein
LQALACGLSADILRHYPQSEQADLSWSHALNEKNQVLVASCRCGQTAIEASGKPIASVSCYCRSCQEAGRLLEALPGAPVLRDPDGGTRCLVFRKDRVRMAKGADRLQEHRLKSDSPTRRVVATCCNTPMFGDYTRGFWLALYRGRLPDGVAPLEMRVMTRERRAGTELPDDVPNCHGHSGRYMWRLLATWVAMGFRSPKIGF